MGPGTRLVNEETYMSTVLVISSQVIRGYVGGTVSRVALEALGHQVWFAPTVLLSNHSAHPHTARETILPESISAVSCWRLTRTAGFTILKRS